MPRAGLEPARPFGPEDFKSSVSAIPPPRRDRGEFKYSLAKLQATRSASGFCFQRRDNPFARMSIAVWIDCARHSFVLRSVIEQPWGALDNSPPVCAHEFDRSRRHAF